MKMQRSPTSKNMSIHYTISFPLKCVCTFILMTLCGLFVTNIDLSAQLRFTQGHSNEICSEPFAQSMKRFVCTFKQTLKSIQT